MSYTQWCKRHYSNTQLNNREVLLDQLDPPFGTCKVAYIPNLTATQLFSGMTETLIMQYLSLDYFLLKFHAVRMHSD